MKTKIKEGSLLHSDDTVYDYVDSFDYVIADPEDKIDILDVAEAFKKPGPKWVARLFTLRNRIVSVFGLKTPAMIEKKDDGENKWEIGSQSGIFKVFGRTDREMLLGEDDKHLDVRVSLSLEQSGPGEKRITVTTAVKLNNRLGRCYFFVIKPFHCTIVPAMMKQNFRQLASKPK